MGKINVIKFTEGFVDEFGVPNDKKWTAIKVLLYMFDASTVFDTKGKISYALATIKRETAETFAPVEEG